MNQGVPVSVHPPLKDSVIYVYCKDYIITDSGRVNIGETFTKDGKRQILQKIDIVYRVVTCEPVIERVPAVSDEGTAGLGENDVSQNSGN